MHAAAGTTHSTTLHEPIACCILEPTHLAGGDLEDRAGAGVAALARSALAHLKRACGDIKIAYERMQNPKAQLVTAAL